MKKSKPKKRNPMASSLKGYKPKIIPDKRKKLKDKLDKKPEHAPIIRGGTNATYDGV